MLPFFFMKKKIGIIDSGIGGLSLLDGFSDAKLNLEYFYCSDNKNVPYGLKSQQFMVERVTKMVESLLEKNVSAILLACNTLTAQTIDFLRSQYSVPFIGIEPYINFSNLHGQENSKISLILTEATFLSDRFQKLKNLKDPNGEVDIFTLKKLALIIELCHGSYTNHKKELEDEFYQLIDKSYTHCILGCTHYPFIKKFIGSFLKVEVVDPTQYVVKEVKRVLDLKKYSLTNDFFEYSSNCGNKWERTSFDYIKNLYFK